MSTVASTSSTGPVFQTQKPKHIRKAEDEHFTVLQMQDLKV